jgi:hypothetical protein
MPIQNIPGTSQQYHLISFDADGNERTDDPQASDLASQRILRSLSNDSITDVFIASHGWKGDIPAAKEQYEKWFGALLGRTEDLERLRQARPQFKPLFIGLHWPSQPWGDESLSNAGISFSTPVDSPVESLVDYYAERVADTPAARQAIRIIVMSALDEMAPAQMPPAVKAAYLTLNQEAGLGQAGETAAPGNDRESFDPEAAYQAARDEEVLSFGGGFDLGGLLSPLRQLSFWKMKDRARRFGENGGTKLLAQMQTTAPQVRFHLMGHSFGCIVISATLAGANGQGSITRPVDSVALVQGALSIWAYCADIPHAPGKPGYFHSIVRDGRVRGVFLTTQSEHDRAVGTFYPIGAGLKKQVAMPVDGSFPKYAALGTFGIRGLNSHITNQQLLSAQQAYSFMPGEIYNLDGSEFICQGDGASGAHSDIAGPEVWHAILEAARLSG